MDRVGQKVADRMARAAASYSAVLVPGDSITLSSPVALRFVVSGAAVTVARRDRERGLRSEVQ